MADITVTTPASSESGDRNHRVAGPRAGLQNQSRQSTAEKVILLLEALAANEHGVGVREVARASGMDKSAASRLLDQLTQMGVAEQASRPVRFHMGPRMFALAATVHGRDTLWQAAEPILRELSARFNESCYLATRESDHVVFREKIDCDHHVRYVIDAGERGPLHAGAGGRAVLAGLPPEEFEATISRLGLTRLTAATITDRDELRRQVAADRQRGYSVSTGERVAGGSAVAAPYYAANGHCRGAIVLTCPAERFDASRVPGIAHAVAAASWQLSLRLGYRPASGGPGPLPWGGSLARPAPGASAT